MWKVEGRDQSLDVVVNKVRFTVNVSTDAGVTTSLLPSSVRLLSGGNAVFVLHVRNFSSFICYPVFIFYLE